jgi:hypothetical protein
LLGAVGDPQPTIQQARANVKKGAEPGFMVGFRQCVMALYVLLKLLRAFVTVNVPSV